jgi:hypothetical protein
VYELAVATLVPALWVIYPVSVERRGGADGPDKIIARRKLVEKSSWDSKAQLVLEKLFGKNETGCSSQTL